MTIETMQSPKLRLVALLLSFFLGCFGAHRFYVGKPGSGVAMLLFTLSFFGIMVTGIWNLVDFIMILTGGFTDKQGFPVKKWTE